jgi:anti-sigma regulatory factor (Ser/Thr protein kinase)
MAWRGQYDAPIPELFPSTDGERWPGPVEPSGFRHEALIYHGRQEFLSGAVSFIRDGVRAGETVLVLVPGEKLESIRAALDSDAGLDDGAGRVEFANMREIGENPSRILPAWIAFVDGSRHGRPMRGVAEPMFEARTSAELDECLQHERLLDVAFGSGPPWRLLCMFDAATVPADVLEESRREHPIVHHGRDTQINHRFRPEDPKRLLALPPLPPRPPQADRLSFTTSYLRAVRRFVLRHARAAGLSTARASDLVLAVNELAANSVRFGGSRGTLWVWRADGALVCEVEDDGQLAQPLAGRRRPEISAESGRGLWMVNQLCDLVQLRSSPAGTSVRVHMRVA